MFTLKKGKAPCGPKVMQPKTACCAKPAKPVEPIREKPSCCASVGQPSLSCCAGGHAKTADAQPAQPAQSGLAWNLRYAGLVAFTAALWWFAYSNALIAANWLAFSLLGLDAKTHLGASVEFFIYDTAKILLLLAALIYLIAWLRAALNAERVRDFLAGKRRGFGYMLGAFFGAVTPFCSCSSIPLFLGFTSARIPVGISMSFLITSPLINEIAVVLLWGLLGWKFTLIYVAVGLSAGIIGGWFMDTLRAERFLQPFIQEVMQHAPVTKTEHSGEQVGKQAGKQAASPLLTIRQRHEFASAETSLIFKRVWKWVFIGVGVAAALHGYVPANWFAENLGAGEWWTVPAAVLVGIPLYSNVTGIVPVMQSLLLKGLPIGTTLAFCMSSVAASLPEFFLLRQIMTFKLQAIFIAYLWVMFTLVGWLFNVIGPYIR